MTLSTQSSVELPLLMVVCTGNICRSPMAEAVLQHQITARGLAAQVASCGLDAPIGRRPHPHAREVNQARGMPINEVKRSQRCSADELRQALIVFVMENHHRHQILNRHIEVGGKTFLLGHWQEQQILDPVHSPLEVFETVYNQIEQGCSAWLDHLVKAKMVG